MSDVLNERHGLAGENSHLLSDGAMWTAVLIPRYFLGVIKYLVNGGSWQRPSLNEGSDQKQQKNLKRFRLNSFVHTPTLLRSRPKHCVSRKGAGAQRPSPEGNVHIGPIPERAAA